MCRNHGNLLLSVWHAQAKPTHLTDRHHGGLDSVARIPGNNALHLLCYHMFALLTEYMSLNKYARRSEEKINKSIKPVITLSDFSMRLTHPFLLIILFMVWDGVLAFLRQTPAFPSSRGLRALHIITHCSSLSDHRGRAVAWKSSGWAGILLAALMVVAL